MEVDESERGGGRLASEVRVFVGRFKSRLLAIKCLGAVWAGLPYAHHSLHNTQYDNIQYTIHNMTGWQGGWITI